jgi:hypothetical protein
MRLADERLWVDVLLALLLFIWPPMTVWLTFALRELGRLRRQRNLDRLEAELMSAEGFPPPDPPTTDQPPRRGV